MDNPFGKVLKAQPTRSALLLPSVPSRQVRFEKYHHPSRNQLKHEKLEPDEAGENEKDTWSWWKGPLVGLGFAGEEIHWSRAERQGWLWHGVRLGFGQGVRPDRPMGQFASEGGGWEDGEIEGVGIIWNILPRSRRWRQWTGAKGSKAIHFQTDVRWHGINHGRGGRWARRADQRTREVLQHHRGEAPVQRSGKRGRNPISTTQKIKTERQSILEACKGKICKTGWQARALQGGGPGVTLLPVVLQGDLPVWAISIAVSAGSLGSEGELVCALFCGWLFLRLQMKRPMSRSCYLACGVQGDAHTCQRRHNSR